MDFDELCRENLDKDAADLDELRRENLDRDAVNLDIPPQVEAEGSVKPDIPLLATR